MIPSLLIPPESLPLSWENDVKTHIRVDTDEERARVEGTLIPACEEWVQALTNRQLINATWSFTYSSFAAAANPYGVIVIPRAPLQAIVAVNYYDSTNVLQTWPDTNYIVRAPAGPRSPAGWLLPVDRTSYPTTFCRPDAVEIQAVCGYGQIPEQVPGGLRQAMLLLLSELFERRELAVQGTIIQNAPLGAVHLGLSYLVEV